MCRNMKSNLCLTFLSSISVVFCNKLLPAELNSIKHAKDNKPDKSYEFLDQIKDDLRRNNDDYAEAMLKTTASIQPTIQGNLKFHYRKEKTNLAEDLKRRAYASLSDEDNAKDSVEDTTITNHPTSKQKPVQIANTMNRFSKMTQPSNPKIQPPIQNMGKLKMYLKNSDLFKQFVRNKAMETTIHMKLKGGQNFKMKARENERGIVLPNSDQLDMAPAKGGRVHMMRIKGRLCQRNVLIPEGPKYDSKGKIYLPAFSSGPSHRNFEQTLAPKILLPRCCNCCKKSVLGCE